MAYHPYHFVGEVLLHSVERMINLVVIPFITRVPNGILQQDNARPYTVVDATNTLENVRILDWLARSPDLSPIELVWDEMGRRIRSYKPQPAIFKNWHSMCFRHNKKFRKIEFGSCLLPCHNVFKSVFVAVGSLLILMMIV